jgi:hypothetical protein
MTSHLNDPGYWRDRAEELRVLAEHLKEPGPREMILGCARDYDLLAERAEERLRSGQADWQGRLSGAASFISTIDEVGRDKAAGE